MTLSHTSFFSFFWSLLGRLKRAKQRLLVVRDRQRKMSVDQSCIVSCLVSPNLIAVGRPDLALFTSDPRGVSLLLYSTRDRQKSNHATPPFV